MDSEGRGAERFQGSFCSLFCSYHLMVVTTADPICTAAPIFLISQPASSPTFPVLHRIAGMEPTPFSPSPLTPSLNSIQHKVSSGAKCSLPALLLLDATSILKGKKLLRCHTEMIPWTADFATSVAWRGGILRVMIPGGECAWFDAVVLSAYKECPAPDEEDRRRYLQRRRRFQGSPCISTCLSSTQRLQFELVQFI